MMRYKHVDNFETKQLLSFSAHFSAIYNKNIIPFSTYKHLETKWPCTMEDFVIKDSELGALSNADSLSLLQTNFPLLQIFIQVK